MNSYLIINNEDGEDAGLFWSREYGWTTENEATEYTEQEQQMLHLPMGGKWFRLENK